MNRIPYFLLSLGVALMLAFGSVGIASADSCATGVIHIINDVDSSNSPGNGSGYWAGDTIDRNISICPTETEGILLATLVDGGGFVSFAGISPNNTGTIGGGVVGTITGGYTVLVNGTIDPSAPADLGTLDMACDPTGACAFPSGTAASLDPMLDGDFTYEIQDDWGWDYNACNGETWTNSAAGNFGDITAQENCPPPPVSDPSTDYHGGKSCYMLGWGPKGCSQKGAGADLWAIYRSRGVLNHVLHPGR